MDLESQDIVLVVSDEDHKMGELRIRRGSVDWWPYKNKIHRWQEAHFKGSRQGVL
jgi:hypothetical protein